jgi:hypothetical protein
MGNFAAGGAIRHQLLLRVFTDVSVLVRCHDAITPE